MSTMSQTRDRIGASEAAGIIGVDPRHIHKLARKGLLTAYRLPGVRPMFSRAEVEALAHTMIVPARTNGAV